MGLNWEELEREFVADGRGNGSLHPYAVHDRDNYWKGGRHKDDFYIGFDFHIDDWVALFWNTLNAARREEYTRGEDIAEFDERYRRRFEASLSQYPLLARISGMYEDAAYGAKEVHQLRDECLRVRGSTKVKEGIRALNKLVLACNKASDRGMALLLMAD